MMAHGSGLCVVEVFLLGGTAVGWLIVQRRVVVLVVMVLSGSIEFDIGRFPENKNCTDLCDVNFLFFDFVLRTEIIRTWQLSYASSRVTVSATSVYKV
jgi:hypothetical protein